jgi:hypothetical protein
LKLSWGEEDVVDCPDLESDRLRDYAAVPNPQPDLDDPL